MFYNLFFTSLPQVTMLGKVKQSGNWNTLGRIAKEHIFVFLISGKGIFTVNDVELKLNAGDYVYLPQGCFYHSFSNSECEFYFLHFYMTNTIKPCTDEELLARIKEHNNLFDSKKLLSHFYFQPTTYDNIFVKNTLSLDRYFQNVIKTLSAMESYHYKNTLNSKLCLDIQFAQFVLFLSNICIESIISQHKTPPILLEMIAYIQNNYRNEVTLTILSDRFRLSKQYIIKLFRIHLHTSGTKYINSLRLAHSLELLKYSSMNINEVSSYVGYNNAYYFSRVFKAEYNMTPSEYIQSDYDIPGQLPIL